MTPFMQRFQGKLGENKIKRNAERDREEKEINRYALISEMGEPVWVTYPVGRALH